MIVCCGWLIETTHAFFGKPDARTWDCTHRCWRERREASAAEASPNCVLSWWFVHEQWTISSVPLASSTGAAPAWPFWSTNREWQGEFYSGNFTNPVKLSDSSADGCWGWGTRRQCDVGTLRKCCILIPPLLKEGILDGGRRRNFHQLYFYFQRFCGRCFMYEISLLVCVVRVVSPWMASSRACLSQHSHSNSHVYCSLRLQWHIEVAESQGRRFMMIAAWCEGLKTQWKTKGRTMIQVFVRTILLLCGVLTEWTAIVFRDATFHWWLERRFISLFFDGWWGKIVGGTPQSVS